MTAARVGVRGVVGRVAYGALFVVILPGLLAGWARLLDRVLMLPDPELPGLGVALALGGAAVFLTGIHSLWTWGGGLPMSAFPPPRLATRGAYALVAHPIYVGAILLTMGLSLWAGSPTGVWVVTPVLLLATVAWVEGFEREQTLRRFGTLPLTLLRLPAGAPEAPASAERLSVYLLVFAPWFVAYMGVELLGVPRDAVSAFLPFESRLPVLPWTELFYAATYPFVLAAPLVARRGADLRRFAVRGLWATALVIPLYLLLPLVAEPRPLPGDGPWQALMRWERAGDAPVTAFPAFHVIWAFLAAQLYAESAPRLRALWWALALAMAASCVTTGMHALIDVAAGVLAWWLIARGAAAWGDLLRLTERVSNSWREWDLGAVRLMSHGLYAALGGALGLLLAMVLAGPANTWWLAGMSVAAIVGSGLWAQLVEGSPQLLRPYGYFGGVFGVCAMFGVAALAGADAWTLLAAFGAGGALTQALGRLRCLVQGCCHGRPAPASLGIRVSHPRSRVVRLANLGGVPIHPTPLYSLLWMLLVCALLVRLWTLAAPPQFIVGVYFILSGVGRFVEEHFRGEPQTAQWGGLRLYQWLSVLFVVCGAGITVVSVGAVPPVSSLVSLQVFASVAVGLFAYVAYGVDFPRSDRRFSRLV